MVGISKGRALPDFRASARLVNDCIPIATSPEEPVVQRFCGVVGEVIGLYSRLRLVGVMQL